MLKLKIALLSYRSDPFSGGQGIYLKNLSDALIRRGHKITIFSGNPLPDVNRNIDLIEIKTPGFFESFEFKKRIDIFKNYPDKKIFDYQDFFDSITGVFSEPIYFAKRLENNKEFLKKAKSFDIFHDNQSISNFSNLISDRLITTVHHPVYIDRDIDIQFEKKFLKKISIKRWYSFLSFQKNNLKKSKIIITPTQSSKNDIANLFSFDRSRIEVLWNGINIKKVESFKPKKFTSKLVSIISSDVPMKNLEIVLKSLKDLSDDGFSIKLKIIGDLREKNNNLIKELQIEDKIEFLPKLSRDQLIENLDNSDIGICPSIYEGFGFPLVEMMSRGLPVIASNGGSLPELLSESGLTFDPFDKDDLTAKIKQMIENTNLREKFALNSLNRMDDFFDWDEYAMKLEPLYQKILSGHF
tara:strand:- start:1606 stop:2841 length:1236 start_codon:yes stop_codon:yes gene_type:complete